MGLGYAQEKYGVAIRSMATGVGSLQERLMDAAGSILRLQKEDMPDPKMWREHQAIHEALTAVKEGPGDGLLQKTLNRMSMDEAKKLADRIYSLNYELQREHDLDVARQRIA